MPSAKDTTRDWDAKQWASTDEERNIDEDVEGSGASTETPEAKRWNKNEWVGDQGDGSHPRPESSDQMPEGQNALSGMRRTPSEQHWAERDDTDRPERD